MMKKLLKMIVLFASMMMGFLMVLLLSMPFASSMSQLANIRYMQILQTVLVFVLPVLLMLWFFKDDVRGFLCLSRPSAKHLLAALASVLLMMPLTNFLVHWNEGLHLPASMAGIEAWMRSQEDAAQAVTQLMLADTSPMGLLLNLLIVAAMAAFGEEFFFRGTLQNLLRHDTDKMPHAAIWMTGFVFSAIHLQFYGFFPRMFMGVWLGYLLCWSKSLWVPMAAHALNNALVVLQSYAVAKTWLPETFGENLGLGSQLWLTLLSALSLLLLALYLSDFRFSLKKRIAKRY